MALGCWGRGCRSCWAGIGAAELPPASRAPRLASSPVEERGKKGELRELLGAGGTENRLKIPREKGIWGGGSWHPEPGGEVAPRPAAPHGQSPKDQDRSLWGSRVPSGAVPTCARGAALCVPPPPWQQTAPLPPAGCRQPLAVGPQPCFPSPFVRLRRACKSRCGGGEGHIGGLGGLGGGVQSDLGFYGGMGMLPLPAPCPTAPHGAWGAGRCLHGAGRLGWMDGGGAANDPWGAAMRGTQLWLWLLLSRAGRERPHRPLRSPHLHAHPPTPPRAPCLHPAGCELGPPRPGPDSAKTDGRGCVLRCGRPHMATS